MKLLHRLGWLFMFELVYSAVQTGLQNMIKEPRIPKEGESTEFFKVSRGRVMGSSGERAICTRVILLQLEVILKRSATDRICLCIEALIGRMGRGEE